MTKVRYVFIASIFLLMISACTKSSTDRLIGEWQGADHTGQFFSILFEKNNNAKLIKGSLVLEGGYDASVSQGIVKLNLKVKRASKTVTTPMILRFLSDDKIQLRIGKGGTTRPTEFSETEDKMQIILKRQ